MAEQHTFTFRLVTPQRLLLEASVEYINVPGTEGYLGILANHAPLITALKPGKVEVRDAAGTTSIYAVSGGFLEVSRNRATVLADTAEAAGEIDRERAQASLKRAEERLRGGGGSGGLGGRSGGAAVAEAVDRDRATRSLDRAKNRLTVAGA